VSYLEQGARLAEIREALQNASTTQDLNVRLQSLLEPALTADQVRKPLDDLRKMLLKENEIQQQKLSKLLMTNVEGEKVFSAINRVGSALGWALAFASGAVLWGSHSTLLERLRRRSRPKT
jgi:DNA-binding transcriptional MerR regulator